MAPCRLFSVSGLVLDMVLAVLAWAAPYSVQAQQVQRIAAVVNDDVVTVQDLQSRMGMVMATSGLPNTRETYDRLLPQVLQLLIDERLKLQEARRIGITVSEADMEDARRRIEENNGMPPGSLRTLGQAMGFEQRTLEAQIRADIAWGMAARTLLFNRVDVEPEEIDAVMETLRRNQGKPERLLAEILLAVDTPQNESRVLGFAQQLSEQIQQGASYSELARQFSSSTTAAVGGDLGWVVEGQLDPDLERALMQMQPGQLSQPIRTSRGYYILLYRDLRDPRRVSPEQLPVILAQAVLPTVGNTALPEAQRQAIEAEAASSAQSWTDLAALAERHSLPSSGIVGSVSPRDLPPELAEVVARLPENRPSRRVVVSGAEVILMVCERQDPTGLPSRDQVRASIESDKFERLSSRALRDLRRAAIIDIRL